MMWVVRAGEDSKYIDKILSSKKIFIPWDGYMFALDQYKTLDEYRNVVRMEKKTENRTSISNWTGQINTFVNEMNIGDYVLVPMYKSREYILAKIKGEYIFKYNDESKLYHSRMIEIKECKIPASIFSQTVRYSLGAFRTIFKVKYEEEILKEIDKWKEESI